MFEGSFLGDAARLADTDRLECGICWTVYDPAEGDPANDVAPGTLFEDLPENWYCPECGAMKADFEPIDE